MSNATADEVELTVMTYTGVSHQLQISLHASLGTLKDKILQCTDIPVEHQRILSMGREIKSNGRSLQTLGVGRFGVLVVHVQSSGRRRRQRTASPAKTTTTTNKNVVVNLCDDSDDEKKSPAVVDMTEDSPRQKRRRVV